MDIGTAKPGAAERARVPHHLIDLVDPDERYSAGQFRRDAIRVIARDLRARQDSPCWSAERCCTTAPVRRPGRHAAGRSEDARCDRCRARRARLACAACRARQDRPEGRGTHHAERCAAHPARARGVPDLRQRHFSAPARRERTAALFHQGIRAGARARGAAPQDRAAFRRHAAGPAWSTKSLA